MILEQQLIVITIAFLDTKTPQDVQALEIQFSVLMRNHTVTGYYTSKVGIAILGYQGDQPNVWEGAPQGVLEERGVTYDPQLQQNASTRANVMKW